MVRANFWLNADGNCGDVGNPIPIINLSQAAASQTACRKFYLSRSWLTGISSGGDGSGLMAGDAVQFAEEEAAAFDRIVRPEALEPGNDGVAAILLLALRCRDGCEEQE